MNKILQYKPIYEKEEREAVKKLMDSDSWFSDFEETKKFEDALKYVSGTKYCSVVNNGTIAISLALLAVGVEPGDKVIVPDLTMIATANAVRFIGAEPVFVDVESLTGCLDLNKVELEINKKVKAIVYVTLNGRFNLEHLNAISELCKSRNIAFIKDDAQSLGSKSSEGKSLQHFSYGDIHTVSFSPHKIISTGQGGALFTDNSVYAERIKRLKDFGRLSGGEDLHDEFGINSKFTEIQAILGIEQVKKIDSKIGNKKGLYDSYSYLLYRVKEVFMYPRFDYHTPWFVDIYVKNRSELVNFLKTNNIGTRNMYPLIHKQKCYGLDYQVMNDMFPVATRLSDEGLWLPSSFDLTERDVIYITNKIKEFYGY